MKFLDVPGEYVTLFEKIPQNQLDIYIKRSSKIASLRMYDNPYLVTIDAIKETINFCEKPDPIWYFILGRMLFISSNYHEILEFGDELPEMEKRIIDPFKSRVLIYQNRFDEANIICNALISHYQSIGINDFIDVFVFFETCFTLGLSNIFNRNLDKLNEIIELLAKTSKSEMAVSLIRKASYSNMVLMIHILMILHSFASGNSTEMRDNLLFTKPLIEEVDDPWLIGYYYNLYTISYVQAQEIEESRKSSQIAINNFRLVRDLRGYSTAGINLGVSYLTQGNREAGRNYLEQSFKPLIELKNYSLTITHMLQVARSYLDENQVEKAMKFANWAEELSLNIEISDPGTYAHFCHFYARTRELNKSDKYLDKMKTLIFKQIDDHPESDYEELTDVYSALWLYSAEGANLLAKGNLELASSCIAHGIQLADRHRHLDFSLELSIISIEILLKQYILFESRIYLNHTLEIFQDMSPLIDNKEISYFKVIYNLFLAYLFRATLRTHEGINVFLQANETDGIDPDSFIFREIQRFNDLMSLGDHKNDLQKKLITDEQLSVLSVLECLRLIRNFQFNTIGSDNFGNAPEVPLMLLIINRANGLSLYDYKFKETSIALNEVLISGFLTAVNDFSKSIFGEGDLSSIRMGDKVILIDSLTDDNVIVLITEEESYLLRKKLRNYSKELLDSKLLDTMEIGAYIHRTDLAVDRLNELTDQIFLTS